MVHDVVVYLSSVPRISDHNRKIQVLTAFAEGAQACGAKVFLQREHVIVPSQLAVIIGWVGKTIRGPHIQLRKDAIAHQQASKNRIMCIDGSCFKYADHDSIFLRYSLDGVYYNQNIYANRESGPEKWRKIQRVLGLDYRDWRQQGDHVLICLQRDGGWNMKDNDLLVWARDAAKTIRQHTGRPILVRPHPKHPVPQDLFQGISGVRISKGTHLIEDLIGAWASVFFNSSSAVASVLAGVPIFVHDEDCVAWDVANHDLSSIESPAMPNRDQWLWDLSAAHRSDEEGRSGEIYRAFQSYL